MKQSILFFILLCIGMLYGQTSALVISTPKGTTAFEINKNHGKTETVIGSCHIENLKTNSVTYKIILDGADNNVTFPIKPGYIMNYTIDIKTETIKTTNKDSTVKTITKTLKSIDQNLPTFHIDFSKKEIDFEKRSKLDKLQVGDFYRIQIDSINLNYWKITVANKDTLIENTAIAFPTFGNLGTDAITKLINGFSPGGIVGELENAKTTEPGVGFTKDMNKIYEEDIHFIDNFIKENKKILESKNKELNTIKTEIDTTIGHYKNYILASLDENMDSEIYKKYHPNKISISEAIPKFDNLRVKISVIQDSIVAHNKTFLETCKILEKKWEKLDTVKKEVEKIKTIYSALINSTASISKAISVDTVQNFLMQLVRISNNSSTTYKTLPLQFTKDQTTISISIDPIDSKSNVTSRKYNYIIPSRRCMFFGINPGLFGGLLSSDYYSYKTTKDSIQGDTVFKLVKENPDVVEVGFSTLFKVGFHFKNSPVNLHFGIGPGISISPKVYPRVLVGGGIAFGRKHLFVIDMGMIAGPVDRLSNVYNVDTEYSIRPQQVTVTRMAANFYFSFGYMFRI